MTQEHHDLHKLPKKQKELLRKILLFTSALLFILAILIFQYPEEVRAATGIDQDVLDVLSPALLMVALGDLVLALFVFHSRDRV